MGFRGQHGRGHSLCHGKIDVSIGVVHAYRYRLVNGLLTDCHCTLRCRHQGLRCLAEAFEEEVQVSRQRPGVRCGVLHQAAPRRLADQAGAGAEVPVEGGAGDPGPGGHHVADATLLLTGAHTGDQVGKSIAGASDLDGDGCDELLIGADALVKLKNLHVLVIGLGGVANIFSVYSTLVWSPSS